MDLSIKTRLVSSLEKVFPDKEPPALNVPISLLKDDIAIFQLAFRPEGLGGMAEIKLESPIADLITIRQVENMPVRMPTVSAADGDYLSDQPGLYPDLLRPSLMGGRYIVLNNQWNAFWVEVESTPETKAGEYPVTLSLILTNIFTKEVYTNTFTVTVKIINAVLPKQTLKRTEWFHADCVADYYRVEPFSEEHWELMEAQMELAGRRGVNMILTPLFTYPLDTATDAERTTVQLVDVQVDKGKYSFGFDKFRRWIEMAKRCGMEYFEMSHLFSQGGAAHSTKVMATVDGEYKQIFGPKDPSNGAPYQAFLAKMLVSLRGVIDELDIHDKVVFHISDEPQLQHLPLYRELKEKLTPYIGDFVIMDALSDYDFYKDGVCGHPVVASNHVTPFLEGETPEDFWVYYCVGQFDRVSNRFIAMPSYRNRIIAEQLYKYDVDGFLQWGYNFYNSIGSICRINPFASTDSGSGFPAGDPFSVYPGDGGKPWSSIRLEVFWQAICDLRAFKLLESLTNKDFVMGLIEAEGEITFFDYPKNADYQLNLRERVNEEIAKRS